MNDEWRISGARTHNFARGKKSIFSKRELASYVPWRHARACTLTTLKRPHGHYKGHRGVEQKSTRVSYQVL